MYGTAKSRDLKNGRCRSCTWPLIGISILGLQNLDLPIWVQNLLHKNLLYIYRPSFPSKLLGLISYFSKIHGNNAPALYTTVESELIEAPKILGLLSRRF